MSRKTLLIAILAGVVSVGPGALSALAADQQTGHLVINIRPDVLITAPVSLTSTASAGDGGSAWSAQFALPVGVKIRLAKGTSATLRIEPLLPTTLSTDSGAPAELSGELSINGASNPIDTGSPATVALNTSGTQQLAVDIMLRGTAPLDTTSLPLRITLDSSDGALHWTSLTQLSWTGPQ